MRHHSWLRLRRKWRLARDVLQRNHTVMRSGGTPGRPTTQTSLETTEEMSLDEVLEDIVEHFTQEH